MQLKEVVPRLLPPHLCHVSGRWKAALMADASGLIPLCEWNFICLLAPRHGQAW